MADYKQGIKKEVAEVKFLIHDLRVERFINEVIHFHVTLNTDLEIYSIDQAQILHGEDLQALKTKAVSLRKALQDYSNAVKSFSPGRTILLLGKRYIDTIHSTCALILNPLWGRIDKVLTFLPEESRSVRSRPHYLNCIRWLRGVHDRITHFLEEQESRDLYAEFDLATEIERFTREVIQGYVEEKSGAGVKIELDRLDPAIVGGNRYRFRRMYFNLVMNAVDAMSARTDGVLAISVVSAEEQVALRVQDNGVGMTEEKTRQLLTDKKTLDGELDSLGFVFVRQTIAQFAGELAIESEKERGTTVTVSFPRARARPAGAPGTGPRPRAPGPEPVGSAAGAPAAAGRGTTPSLEERNSSCGRTVYRDYEISEAPFPGVIFAISVAEDDRVDFFTHRPYERYWNITHEDLSPMLYQATVRGRLEEDEERKPVVILQAPRDLGQYFDFKNVPAPERTPERHAHMVHDELIRIARKLIETGLPPQITVKLAELRRCLPDQEALVSDAGSFPLETLAGQSLTTERTA